MGALTEDLIIALKNEKAVSTILPFQTKTIEELKKYIEEQKIRLKSEYQSLERTIKVICELELERVGFFLADYFRIRLKKICKNFGVKIEFLNEKEIEFKKKYEEICKKRDVFIENPTDKDEEEFVGFIALSDLGHIKIENYEVLIETGDFFVCRFFEIKEFVFSGEIELF